MATLTSVILRPDATIQSGLGYSFNGTSMHGSVADAYDTTIIRSTYAGGNWGASDGWSNNGAIDARYATVSFANATGVVPANKTIVSVEVRARLKYTWALLGGAGTVSIRYADDSILGILAPVQATVYTTGSGTVELTTGQTLTAPLYVGGTNRGAWTYELIDGLQVAFGGKYSLQDSSHTHLTNADIADVWLVVRYVDKPVAPTTITPANSATVTTAQPTLSATLVAIATANRQRCEWQLATDSGFTANVMTLTESTSYLRTSGVTYQYPTVATLVVQPNGTWYIHARALDEFGVYGPYSITQSFTSNVIQPSTPIQVAVAPILGTISALASYSTYTPDKAIDGVLSTAWMMTGGVGWLQVYHPTPTVITSYTITPYSAYTPKTWTFQGSNDNVTWDTLDTQTNITTGWVNTTPQTPRTFSFSNSTAYSRYRLNFTASNSSYIGIVELDLSPSLEITTEQPRVKATIVATSDSKKQRVWWQLATDNGFTQHFTQTSDPTVATSLPYRGVVSIQLPLASKLTANGTWYIRAYTVGIDGTTSAFSTTQTFTVALAPPPMPTVILPTQSSTVTSNIPVLSGTIGVSPESRSSRMRWQLATDADFTANIRTVDEPSTALSHTASVHRMAVPIASKLTQTTWYIRGWAVDGTDAISSVTAGQSFIITHKPSTSGHSPTAAQPIIWSDTANRFSWNFSDPDTSDQQRAYQITISRQDTGATISTTDKIVYSDLYGDVAIDSAYKDMLLRWQVKVWDQDDIASDWSNYQLFIPTDPVTVSITNPMADGVVDSARPTITWTNDSATIPSKYAVNFYRYTGEWLYGSGITDGPSLSWRPSVAALRNANAYTVTVTVTDSMGLVGTDTHSFTVAYTAPEEVSYSVDAEPYKERGFVAIDWTLQQPDTNWLCWRVYRREQDVTDWELLFETSNVNYVTYKDWLARSEYSYQYAVTQTAQRDEVVIESALADDSVLYPLSTESGYWFINPIDESYNLQLYSVTEDSYTNEIQEESYIVIDRGRRTNYGTTLGKTGSLKGQLRNRIEFGGAPGVIISARTQRILLEALQENRSAVYMRDPFGNLIQVGLGSVQVTRIAGVGNQEFVDVTIGYSEVF